MTFDQMVDELEARGFGYLTPARRQALINQALHELYERHEWSFLEANTSGTAPLTIADFRVAQNVHDATNGCRLIFREKRWLQQNYPADSTLAETGTPTFYYVEGDSTIVTYPASTVTLNVDYIEIPDDLSGSQEPPMHSRWHSLAIDIAEARAMRERDDDERAALMQQEVERQIQYMIGTLRRGDDAGWIVAAEGVDM